METLVSGKFTPSLITCKLGASLLWAVARKPSFGQDTNQAVGNELLLGRRSQQPETKKIINLRYFTCLFSAVTKYISTPKSVTNTISVGEVQRKPRMLQPFVFADWLNSMSGEATLRKSTWNIHHKLRQGEVKYIIDELEWKSPTCVFARCTERTVFEGLSLIEMTGPWSAITCSKCKEMLSTI